MVQSQQFFLAFQLVTCGLQNNDLGRDETAILQIGFQLIDASNNQVVGGKLILLQASSLLDPSANHDKIHISVPAREMTELLSSSSSYSTINLQEALNEVDAYIMDHIPKDSIQPIEIIPVTVGHLPLRSVLHRETRFRNINLNSYWYHYYNLCDQVSTFCNLSIQNLEEITNALHIDKPGVTTSIFILNMTTAIIHLLHSGHTFHSKQTIKNSYKPIVFHVDDSIESDVVVMIKPIDYRTPISQIIPFFKGLNIADGGIAVIMSEGRRSNRILVKFEDKLQRDVSLLRDKHHMEPGNTRFITISVFDSQQFMKIAGYQDENVKTYLQLIKDSDQILVRIKGLPYTVTKNDILTFFYANDVEVQFSYDGIFLVQKPSGDLNGDAFVIFENEIVAQKAKNLKGMTIGNRYMEIFYSTPPEMNQVIAAASKGTIKHKQSKTSVKNSDGLSPNILKMSSIPDPITTSAITRYIPIEASDSDFIKYMGDFQNLYIKISRSGLYNLSGHISYITVFKTLSDAEMVIKILRDKPFKIELSNKEVAVETLLINKIDEKQFSYHQLFQKIVSNTLPQNNCLNMLSSISQYPSILLPQPINIQNALNLTGLNGSLLNYGAFPNLYTTNSPINLVPNPNLFMINQIPLSMSLGTGSNAKLLTGQDLLANSIKPHSTLADYYQNASLSYSTVNKSKILFMSGVSTRLVQQDLDIIFRSIASNISMLPKLIQHNQFSYAVFNCLEDANIALQRCPIILYNNQMIRLIPVNE